MRNPTRSWYIAAMHATPHRLSTLLALCIIAAGILCGVGCDNKDAQAIRAMLVQYDTANNSKNGRLAKECVTKSSDAQYESIRRHALYSDERTVRALGPYIKHQVLMTRNRASAAQLEVLTGEDYLVWTTNEGWFANGDSGWSTAFGKIAVKGDFATGVVLQDDKPTGDKVHFLKEDGRWRLDETTMGQHMDQWYLDLAKFEGVSVDDLLIFIEEEDSGKEISDSIWQPMIRK